MQDAEPIESAYEMVRQADNLLEENDFASARDLYRSAAKLSEPTRHLLVNLSVAEEQDALAFARELRQRYPGSRIVWMHSINALLHAGAQWNTHAISLCTELLQDRTITNEEQLKFRVLRFCAVTRSTYQGPDDLVQLFVEDFTAVWRSSGNTSAANRMRQELLYHVAAMNEQNSIGLLEILAKEDWLSEDVYGFVRAKLEALKLLAKPDANIA